MDHDAEVPVEIRPLRRSDEVAVAELTRRAFDAEFGTSPEVRLLEQLRAVETGMLEVVAESGGRVIGHAAATRARLPADIPATIFCLGPMAVQPDMQRRGIGQRLVARLLDRSWEAGAVAVVLIGHPEFYTRRGFEPAAPLGFTTDFDVPPEVFLVATRPDAKAVDGYAIRYAPPFYEL